MGQAFIDSARAGAEADRVASEARQNLKQVFLSLRNCIREVSKTKWMLEVDCECTCVVNNNDHGESKWEERNELYEAAESMESALDLLDNSLIGTETRFAIADPQFARPCPTTIPRIEGDNLYWCNRVCVHEEVNMDSALWCTTPPTIMEMVFARLPVRQIFQLRVLSKHWRASIISPSFQHASGTTSSRRFAIVAGPVAVPLRKLIWSFGTRESKWYTLPFDFLPRECNNPVVGDGGLLCCRHRGPSNRTKDLYVCNPLTQAWRKLLLPLQVQGFDLVHLVTNKQTKHYTITAVSDLQQNEHHTGSAKAVVEVYDSARKTWSDSGNGVFQPGGGDNLFYYKKYVEGKFVGIRAYDKTTGYSMSIPCNFLDDINVDGIILNDIISAEMSGFVRLVEHQGQIYVLLTDLATCGVWVLHSPSHTWKKLYSVPEPEDFKYYLFSLFVSTDAIIIYGHPRVFHDDDMEMEFYEDSEAPENPYFWMLDRSQETWLDMANHELNYLPWSQIMFEMRLDAVP